VGRTPIGDVAMTGAERIRRYRERRSAERKRERNMETIDGRFAQALDDLNALWHVALNAAPVACTEEIRADIDCAGNFVELARKNMRTVLLTGRSPYEGPQEGA
jgi:hypothetical protein